MYRLGMERLLGITRFADHLEIHPRIPSTWKEYQINYCYGNTLYHIRVVNPNGGTSEVSQIEINGKRLAGFEIPLGDDGRAHEVVVTMQ